MLLVAPLLVLGCGTDADGPGAASTPPSADVAGPAALTCAQPAVDFGPVWEGDVLEHEFRLTVGPEELVVHNVVADCGCTVPRLQRVDATGRTEVAEGDAVPAGSTLALRVAMDTGGRPGQTRRSIKLYTNRGEGVFAVTLAADVRPMFLVEPNPLPLLRVPQGRTGELDFRVRATTGAAFALAYEPRPGTPLGVSVEPLEPDRGGRATAWSVHVATAADAAPGASSYPLLLRSDVERTPAGDDAPRTSAADAEATLAVEPVLSVQVLAAVTLTPPQVSFGAVRANETVAQTLRLTSSDPDVRLGEPRLALEALEGGPLARTARLVARPVTGQDAWDLEVVLDGLDPEVGASFRARLVVTTDHPRVPTLVAPVSGFRAAGGGATAAPSSLPPSPARRGAGGAR